MTQSIKLVAKVKERPPEIAVRHLVGFPPELTDGRDHRKELERAHVLIIEQNDNGIFLFRLSWNGTYVGDTWHRSVEDAKHQALAEFGCSSSDWKELPLDEAPLAFVSREMSEAQGERPKPPGPDST